MKLQAHYNKISITATIIVLLIAGVGSYFLLKNVLTAQLDETLEVEEAEIYDYVKKNKNIPEASSYDDQHIFFEKKAGPPFRTFSNLELVDPEDNEKENIRQLIFPITVNGEAYIATIRKSADSTRELIWLILYSTLALLLILSVLFFFINRFLIKKLWQPFYFTLSVIKKFNLSAPGNIETPSTHITEFSELNESVGMMAEKVKQDYQSLKNFTDHASHELQTPLAVIHSKLDILIQQPELNEQSMELIQHIYTSVEKLAGLSQTLLLLAKIEQKKFTQTDTVSLRTIVVEKVAEMQDWIQAAQLDVVTDENDVNISIDKNLAAILVSNLLKNAVQHSPSKGIIFIEMGDDHLTVSNTGYEPLDPTKIFDRFNKSGNSPGHGLGLSIISQICEQYKFQCRYLYKPGKHILSILFR